MIVRMVVLGALALAVGAGGAGAQEVGLCDMTGQITYNGTPVNQKQIDCLHANKTKVKTVTTDSVGNYICNDLDEGSVTLRYNGNEAGPCPRDCDEPPGAETCFADVTGGCNNNSVTFSLLLLPPALLAPLVRRRVRHRVSSAAA